MRPREIAAELAGMLNDYLVTGGQKEAEPEKHLQRRLRALADAIAPAPSSAPSSSTTGWSERAVFAYWQRVCDKPRAKFTPERQAKVRARLREGYTLKDIQAAIDACAGSAWHRGENQHHREYTDLTLICQTGSKLEQFIELGGGSRSPEPMGPTSATIERHGQLVELAKVAAEQLKEGNTDAYNRTQAQIRALRAGGGGDQPGSARRERRDAAREPS